MTEYERGFIDGIKSKVSAELTPTLINVSKTMLEILKPVLSTALENALNDNNAITDTDVQPVKWISVNDKLPEWDKTVLVWYASDTLFGVSEGYGLSWYHGSWRLNDLNGENIRIFYWQYLPEKPKGGESK